MAGPAPVDADAVAERKPHDDSDTAASHAGAPGGRSALQIFFLMTALCLSVFLAALDMTIVTTALPTIADHFGSSAGFAWVGSAFMVGAAATTASWGKFSDVWGRKPVLLAANAVFLLGCALCGAAASVAMLIAGRAVQGVGSGGLLTLANIIIGDLFSARERGKYYGMIGMVWATASAMGPVVGGAFTSNVSWRWCFYMNLPISGAAFAIIVVALRLPSPRTPLVAGLRAIDWLGSLAVTGGVLMLLLGLQFGGDAFPWRSATVVCLLVSGAAALVLFVVVEHTVATHPVIPTHLYADRANLAVLLVCLFHGLAFSLLTYFLPLYFQAVLGATPLLSGVWLLPMTLALSLCAAGSGLYLKATGRYRDPITAGFLLAVLGAGLLYGLPRPGHRAWARIVAYQIVAGAGLGLNFQPPLVALQSNVAQQDNAAATASFTLVRSAAAAIGVVVGSATLANRMAARYDAVLAAVGDAALARRLTGAAAQANLLLVGTLPAPAQRAVRGALYAAQRAIWIEAACFAAAALLASLLVRAQPLRRAQEVVQTGLAGEEARRQIALARKAERQNRGAAGKEAA